MAQDFTAEIFTALVPVNGNAARIVLRDPLGNAAGTIALGGTAPSLAITFPAGGETLSGEQAVMWSVSDPDSSVHTFRVEYSTDGGANWQMFSTNIDDASLIVGFDELPGSSGNALIRVLASDGANTGVGVSQPFTVPSKSPRVGLIAPDDGRSYELGDLVWLQGVGWDPEDGYLKGSAMQWASTLDGLLGTGDELHVTDLSPGTHTITLTATDPDANQATDTITVTVIDSADPVGGIVELPEVAGAPLEAPDSSGSNAGLLAGIAAAIAAGTVTLGGAAWYARRRRARAR